VQNTQEKAEALAQKWGTKHALRIDHGVEFDSWVMTNFPTEKGQELG